MAYSSQFGVRCPSAQDAASPEPTHTVRNDTNGERAAVAAVPAAYGGRHHMGTHGPAALSEMIPERPWGMNAAAKQYGGRHHYGAEIRAQMQREASSPDNVADQVLSEMFGAVSGDSEEALLAEAEALLDEAEIEG